MVKPQDESARLTPALPQSRVLDVPIWRPYCDRPVSPNLEFSLVFHRFNVFSEFFICLHHETWRGRMDQAFIEWQAQNNALVLLL